MIASSRTSGALVSLLVLSGCHTLLPFRGDRGDATPPGLEQRVSELDRLDLGADLAPGADLTSQLDLVMDGPAKRDAPKLDAAPSLVAWVKVFGAASTDDGVDLALAPGSGHILLAAESIASGTLDYGGAALSGVGASDHVFASYTAGGVHEWSHPFGSAANDQYSGVAVDGAGNVYLAASVSGPVVFAGETRCPTGASCVLVGSLTAGGALRWLDAGLSSAGATRVGGIALDPQNDRVVVAGWFSSDLACPIALKSAIGGKDLFLATFGMADGAPHSLVAHGGPSDDSVIAVVVEAGVALVTGSIGSGFSMASGVLPHAGGSDVLLAGFDVASGNAVWATSYGGSPNSSEGGTALAAGAGAIYLGGNHSAALALPGSCALTSSGPEDGFVARLAMLSAGKCCSCTWARSLSGSGAVALADLALDGQLHAVGSFGGSLTAGTTTLASKGGTDGFLVRLDTGGGISGAWSFGAGSTDNINAVAASGGVVAISGQCLGTVSFGGLAAPCTKGGYDLFLARLQLP